MSLYDDIIGHATVIAMLEADGSRPAHAYMFVGPAGVGKATVARRFAASILCHDDGNGQRRVLAGVHPDLVLIEPEGSTALTVDQARQAVSLSNLTPVESERKVFVVEEAGLMNDQAANALLKTLEEPTASTVFVLVTESEDDLPDTVASRCRTVRFGRVSEEILVPALQARGRDEARAVEAARISGGRPGLALSLGDADFSRFRRAWLGVPARVTGSPGDAYRLAEAVIASGRPLIESLSLGREANQERAERATKRAAGALHVSGLEMLASWYRDAAAAQFGAPVRNKDVAPAQFTTMGPAAAVARAGRVLKTIEALEANQKPELALAALFTDLGQMD